MHRAGVGSYRFSMTQPGSDQPVGYDPCEPIRVVHNPQNAPANAQELLETAIRHTEEATGLRFDLAGTSDERDFLDRYGGFARRGEPVLVGWATAEEVPELAGDVAGLGGSTAIELRPGRMEYVTGTVVLDQELFDDLDDDPADQSDAQGIVDHEFGHLVGLDHVNDPRELMHARAGRRDDVRPGRSRGIGAAREHSLLVTWPLWAAGHALSCCGTSYETSAMALEPLTSRSRAQKTCRRKCREGRKPRRFRPSSSPARQPGSSRLAKS